jgi:TolB-like protein
MKSSPPSAPVGWAKCGKRGIHAWGRIVAIKKVKEQHSERFKQEARSIAALNHPNICQIFDIGDDYLVLEYVEGKSLSSPLPEQEALQLAIQIATALEEAHQQGIIHRDLKPSNIMITDKGSVKLLDFGLAKLYEQDQSISSLPTEDAPATQTGAILGTVAYMSPEQAQGLPADARSDIFSFGLVLYETLSGLKGFSGDSTPETMAALLRDEPPPLQASAPLERIVRRCLEKKPSDRYQRMSELKVDLVKATVKKVEVSAEEPQPSIAVLPFVNMSGDKEQEYFSDGLAEEIINVLAHIRSLRVAGRTSSFFFRGKDVEFSEIGKRLNVGHILEGSVRKAGNRIRVTAQLIKVSDGFHLWSERYDRDLTDIFAIQDEIATAIANALQVKLSVSSAAQTRYKPNPDAHEAYLRGRHILLKIRPETLPKAKEYFEEAISLDPEYALAYLDLADYFLVRAIASYNPAHEAMPSVRKQAEKALEIDSSFAEAHAMLGIVAGQYNFDWNEAERQFRLAMADDPVSPRIRHWYAFWYLLPLGRTEEALSHALQSVKEDPLSLRNHYGLACCLLAMGRLKEAQSEGCRMLEIEDNYWVGFYTLALAYAAQEKWAEALEFAEKASPFFLPAVGILAGILKRLGETGRAEELMQKLMPDSNYCAPLGLAAYHVM